MVEENRLSPFKPLPAYKPKSPKKLYELLINLRLVTFGPEHEKHVLKLLDEANREWLNL